ncbi:MAG TPA: hypothetical protein DCG57_07035 [Candidatus Riflebacteria bacterium]|jgi:hypothetical protein|nr:hypothetical protein [Candidatus Riflebacteria bacterium]
MQFEEISKKCGALAISLLLFYVSYLWIQNGPVEGAREAKTSHWIPAIATVTGKRIERQYVHGIGDENILVLNLSWSVGTQTISIEYGQTRSTDIDRVNRASENRPLGCELEIKVDPANPRRFTYVEFGALEGYSEIFTYMMGIFYCVLGLYFLKIGFSESAWHNE